MVLNSVLKRLALVLALIAPAAVSADETAITVDQETLQLAQALIVPSEPVEPNISIAPGIVLEETLVHPGKHRASEIPGCPRCRFYGNRPLGHCKVGGRLYQCTRR